MSEKLDQDKIYSYQQVSEYQTLLLGTTFTGYEIQVCPYKNIYLTRD